MKYQLSHNRSSIVYIGTDRSNIVQMSATDISYPLLSSGTLVKNARIVHKMDPTLQTTSADDLAVMMASSCMFTTKAQLDRFPNALFVRKLKEYGELDLYPPSCSLPLLKLTRGTYYFMCTRNNNFSNRSQKGRLTIA